MTTSALISAFIAEIIKDITKHQITDFINKEISTSPQKDQNQLHAEIPEELRRQYLLENKIYIQPYIIPNGSTSKKRLHDFFIKKVFTRESKEPHDVYIIFGDTGTGKTAALVHLFDDYVTQYKQGEHPYPNIKFFSLRDTTLETISNLPDKENTILLLDALDETPAAQDPTLFPQFQEGLQALFHGFARVVITCRPQLFSNQKATFDFTHPIIRTSNSWVKCTELFLAPFDNRQINQYLRQVFPIIKNHKEREKAKEIVKKHADIAIRPLVLTYIKDIVESKRDINTSLDLYDIIIEKTLQRDLEKIYPVPTEEQIKQWWNITSDVAGYMYRNNKLSINEQELDSIESVTKEPQFKQRSMLTLTVNGFHFPHKSFYEYFMAYRFLDYPEEIRKGSLYTMDFALQLYDELLDNISSSSPIRNVNHNEIDYNKISTSLENIGVELVNINRTLEGTMKRLTSVDIRREHPDSFKNSKWLEKKHLTSLLENTSIVITRNKLLNPKDPIQIKYYLNAEIPSPLKAVLDENQGNFNEAEQAYIKRQNYIIELLKNSTDVFLFFELLTIQDRLASIYKRIKKFDSAINIYNATLDILKNCYKEDPNFSKKYEAGTYYNLALTYLNMVDPDLTSAEKAAQESLKIYQNMKEINQTVSDPDVKDAEELLDEIQRLKQQK